MRGNLNIISGNCPNCQKKMFFPEHEASVECTGCGQRHAQSNLQNLQVTGMLEAIQNLLEKLRQRDAGQMPIPDQDSSKVNGLSNYLCAMLSPLLTTHGMDKVTGTAKLLTEMGKSSIFDCSQLADRAFLIDPEHMNVPGYGRDKSGSVEYLKQTLGIIKKCNENEERLVPIHADGDGHCLVHAVSRALVGWQLFWHPLRMNLIHHFRTNFPKYQMQFQDFIDESEWQLIIRECEPDFIPIGAEPTGLRNIHIFGLANVLKRPIILLDSLEGIQSPGDYSAIFLPCFSSPSECMNKDGVLNTPICIAWSSPGRNHFIPLVGVKGKKCPVLPKFMVQRAWGVADTEIQNYVKMDEHGCCQIGGEKVLQPAYFQRLVAAMSELFDKTNRISAALLADMYHHVFKAHGFVFGMNIELLMDKTKLSVEERLLFMCTMCHSLCLANDISEDRLYPGGDLYSRAMSLDGKLREKVPYKLHVCKALYDATQDRLVVIKGTHKPSGCPHCAKPEAEFRLVDADYKVHYKNGDRTTTRSNKCSCGFKHFYNGHEYDGTSKRVKVDLEWGGRSFIRVLDWFQDQEDVNLNSNAYELAQNLVQELFPGEFGSERLVQRVVDQILQQTQIPEMDTNSIVPKSSGRTSASQHAMNDHQASWSADTVSKVILTGHQSVHKEELTKSEAEKKVRQQISANAPKQQRKLSDQMTAERRHSPESGNQKTQVNQSSVSNTSSGNTAAGFSNPLATNKRIRLSTSDGRNVTLDLPSECTFTELQSLISSSLGVTPTNQRIRHGFPPRELKPPPGSGSDFKVPIQPGDKIMLDIIDQLEPKAKSAKVSTDVRKIIHPLTPSKGLSWTSFAEGEFDEASDRVLQGLMDPLLTSGGDNLDHSLSALALTAALDNKELWPYVIQRPHLFSVNGLFYKQVERDMGLDHGKHCQLPLLPHKVFVYNRYDDRLELCLEPYGHFPIESNVERNAFSMLPASKCVSKPGGKPFTGQGHSLRSSTSQEERMPTDIPMSPKRNEARRLNNMCDPASRQESIEEEDEDIEKVLDDSASHRLNPAQVIRNLPLIKNALGAHLPEAKLVRKGPGYSELSPIPENTVNERIDLLHQWVNRMEKVVESIDRDAKAAEEKSQLSSVYKSTKESPTHSSSFPSPPIFQALENKSNELASLNRFSESGMNNSSRSPASPSEATNVHLNSKEYNESLKSDLSVSPSKSSESWSGQSNPIAALAEKVAFNIAAMDTESDLCSSRQCTPLNDSHVQSQDVTMEATVTSSETYIESDMSDNIIAITEQAPDSDREDLKNNALPELMDSS